MHPVLRTSTMDHTKVIKFLIQHSHALIDEIVGIKS